MPKYELNFAWFGPNDIPDPQLQNMLRMSLLHKDCRKIVWIIEDPNHPNAMNPKQRTLLQSIGYELKDISSLTSAETMPTTHALVQKLKESTLYSALGDILKFIVLTRETDPDVPRFQLSGEDSLSEENPPLKRFYMEGDNRYSENLDAIVKGRGLVFAGKIESKGGVYIAADSFYVDVEDRADNVTGSHFKRTVRPILEGFLSDNEIKRALNRLVSINRDPQKPSLNQEDIIESFGQIPVTILTLTMRTLSSDIGVLRASCSDNFAKRHYFDIVSWRNQVPLTRQRMTQSAMAVKFRCMHVMSGETKPLTFQYGTKLVSETDVIKYLTSDAGRDAGVDELRIPFDRPASMTKLKPAAQ